MLSGDKQKSSSQRRILTSVGRPGLSLGTLGETLSKPSSEVVFSKNEFPPQQPSFAPRILSLPVESESQDDAFLFRPVIDELHSVSRPQTPIEIPRSTVLQPKPKTTIRLKDVKNEITPGDDTIDDDDIDSLPISTVIPAIISAMKDKTTSPKQQSSLISLLSDMVELQSARQQKQANNLGNIANTANSNQRVQG